MSGIDSRQMEQLNQKLSKLLEELPQERRRFHEEIGRLIERKMDSAVDSSVGAGGGKLRSWQKLHIGSKGGYAAMRPKKGRATNAKGRKTKYRIGHVTQSIDGGHRISSRRTTSKNYRPRIHRIFVNGLDFYRTARNAVAQDVEMLAERFTKEIAQMLEEHS